MENHFFSDKNVGNLTTTLIKQLNVKDNPEYRGKCEKLLRQQMREVYKKYGNNRPPKMKATEFLGALNNKSIKQTVTIFDSIKNKKKQNKSSELAELKKNRDSLTHNQR